MDIVKILVHFLSSFMTFKREFQRNNVLLLSKTYVKLHYMNNL